MENEKKNQYIIIGIISILLIVVISFTVISVFNNKKEDKLSTSIKLQQIYSSDYKLSFLNDKYFIGTYEDNKISIIIDNNGKEIYNGLEDIYYEGIYPLKDGTYLIYNNLDKTLNTYIFDGKNISPYYKIDNIEGAKPLLFTDNKQEYIIGFISDNENSTYIIPLDNTGFIVLENKKVIADRQENGIYYTYNENYLIAKDNNNLTGVINKTGDIILDFQYQNILNSYNNSFIIQNEKNKYGIIDKDKNILLKPNYKVIDSYNDYYLIVNNQNKMALFDKQYQNLTGFNMAYDDLIKYDFRNKNNSIKLYTLGSYNLIINNYLENINGTEYNKHNLYIINEGKIIKNIKEIGFNITDIIYTLDKDKTVALYNKKMDIISEFKISELKKLISITYASATSIRVIYLDEEDNRNEKYFSLDGEEIPNNLGDLIFNNAVYSGYLENNGSSKKLSLYNNDLKKVSEISGEILEIEKEYVIADNSIYKIVVS